MLALVAMELAMNKAWHAANPMPPSASREQRVRWHAAHARACACRAVPAGLRKDVVKLLAIRSNAGKRK
jgi:hypothetical protein